jgi:hypothetical protein
MILSFLENIHKKYLEFGHMHENKIFFVYLKWGIFLNFKEKSNIFNTIFVSYKISLRSNVRQNC